MIQTDRLTIRNVLKKDIKFLYYLFSDPELMQLYDMKPLGDLSSSNDFLASLLSPDEYLILYDDQPVGSLAIVGRRPNHGTIEIAYVLSKDYWQRGIMSEALHAFCNYCFITSDIHRIEAFVLPDNTGSIRLLEKVGFQFEACLRQRKKQAVIFQDHLLYSLLKREFTPSLPKWHDE